MRMFDLNSKAEYIGLWYIDEYPDCILYGTLYIEKESIYIDLYFQNIKEIIPEELKELHGNACYIDKQNGREKQTFLSLKDLSLKSCNLFIGSGLKHYKYEVKEVYFSDNNINYELIKEVCLRIPILDEWMYGIMDNTFNNIEACSNPKEITSLNPLPHYNLYESSDLDILIYFNPTSYYGSISHIIKQKTFISCKFKNERTFEDVKDEINKYLYLLYLLLNREFYIEYTIFTTTTGSFTHKTNPKFSYLHFYENSQTGPHSRFSDFTLSEIQSIFNKWDILYNEQTDAINLYYETICNTYLPPSSKIRNYISFIDSVTKSIQGDILQINPNTKRAKSAQKILEKTKEILNEDEQNRLKILLLRINPMELKSRFTKLISNIKDLLPNDITKEFIQKVVDTRNEITHHNTKETFIFNKSEYDEVAYKLTQIIRAYLLNKLNINKDLIKNFVKY